MSAPSKLNLGFALAKALLDADLEPENPSPAKKRKAKDLLKDLYQQNARLPLDWDDFADLEPWAQTAALELADELEGEYTPDPDADENTRSTSLELHNKHANWFRCGLGSPGRRHASSYLVCKDDDTAILLATDSVLDQLRADPETFNSTWLYDFIDLDHLRSELYHDQHALNADTFDEEHPDYPDKRDFLIDDGFLERDEFFVTKTDEDGDESDEELELTSELETLIDLTVENWIEDRTNKDLEDPIAFLTDIYGKEDGLATAAKLGGINYDEAASSAVSADGAAHYLAHYDSEENSLPGGAVYYREN